jgi:hypothetical protein
MGGRRGPTVGADLRGWRGPVGGALGGLGADAAEERAPAVTLIARRRSVIWKANALKHPESSRPGGAGGAVAVPAKCVHRLFREVPRRWEAMEWALCRARSSMRLAECEDEA